MDIKKDTSRIDLSQQIVAGSEIHPLTMEMIGDVLEEDVLLHRFFSTE